MTTKLIHKPQFLNVSAQRDKTQQKLFFTLNVHTFGAARQLSPENNFFYIYLRTRQRFANHFSIN